MEPVLDPRPRLDHIGIVVEDVSEARRFFVEVLGLPVTRDEVSSLGNHIVGFQCGPVELECIEVGDPMARLYRLGGARARIEHLGVQVSDLGAWVEATSKAGVATTTREQLHGRRGPYVWTEAVTSAGIPLEVVETEAIQEG